MAIYIILGIFVVIILYGITIYNHLIRSKSPTADANFRDLQTQLAGIEDEVHAARRYYNGAARNFNVLIESFPSNLIAGLFHFQKADFFEIGDEAARNVPKVGFGPA